MRLAVIGQSGQLARALSRECAAQKITADFYGRSSLGLTSEAVEIEAFIESLKVDAVIIAAAYTAVDLAEDDEATAFAANANAPAAIARACTRRDMALVHISTDYVFQGLADAPYSVDATPNPINAYGRSKFEGEKLVLGNHDRAAILRTSWVYDGTGRNFLTTMLKLGQSRDGLKVVADQIGRPTYAGNLALACLTITEALLAEDGKKFRGLYHVSDSGEPISWAGFAQSIFEKAPDDLTRGTIVTPIPSSEYPTRAKRPAYSVLDISRYETSFGALPHWRKGLEQALTEWENNKS